MVDSEDYLDVGKTYPKHPINDIKPQVITKTELSQYRKNVEKRDISKKKSDRDAKVAHLQTVSFKDYYQP